MASQKGHRLAKVTDLRQSTRSQESKPYRSGIVSKMRVLARGMAFSFVLNNRPAIRLLMV